MNGWREVKLNGRLLGSLALLLVALSAFRWWEVSSQAGTETAAGLKPQPELLVDARWLGEHLGDAGLRIVDLRPAADYRAGHIPGAVPFPADALFVDRGGVPGMLPELAELERLFRAAGIGANTIVIGYDGNTGISAARLFFALDVASQGRGRVLNGGWGEWTAAGLPVSTEPVQVAPSDFKAAPQAERLADADWMKAHLDDRGVAILDARSAKEYEGRSGAAQRLGHIPGARWSEWTDSLEPGTQRYRAPEALLAMLAERGITPDKEVAPYCQSFARAAHSYFMLRWLGFPRVRGYDGSWAEWGNRTDTPIDRGPPGPPPSGNAAPSSGDSVAAAPATAASAELRPGLTEAQVRGLLGAPRQVESQNPCWGRQSVWRYPAGGSAQAPLRLTFLDGVLRRIER